MLRLQDGNPAKNYGGYDGFGTLKTGLLHDLQKDDFEDVDIVNMTCLPHSAVAVRPDRRCRQTLGIACGR